MPFQNPNLHGRVSAGQLQRAINNITLSSRPGSGIVVAKVGNHYQISTTPQRGGGGGGIEIDARLTAYDSTNNIYTGIKIKPNGTGGWSDVSPTITFTGIFEKHRFIGAELGSRVKLTPRGAWTGSTSILAAGTTVYDFVFVLPRQTFDVVVVQTGGSNGNATTAASYSYRCESPDGHILGTNKSPVFTGFRGSRGLVTAGTRGIASYDDAGVLTLLTVNEVHGSVAGCS